VSADGGDLIRNAMGVEERAALGLAIPGDPA
jgi:hypothetical protein